MNRIGEQVGRLRVKNGWTQEQMTAKCNLEGFNISRGTLAKIESKTRKVSDFEVELLCRALNVDPNTLFLESN